VTLRARPPRGSANAGHGIVIGLIVVVVMCMGSTAARASPPTEHLTLSNARHDPPGQHGAARLGVPAIHLGTTSHTGEALAGSWPVLVAACVVMTIGCVALGIATSRTKEPSRAPFLTDRRLVSDPESEPRHQIVAPRRAFDGGRKRTRETAGDQRMTLKTALVDGRRIEGLRTITYQRTATARGQVRNGKPR
jgi:hypothetical protein